jgi:hypothetical protein
VSDPLVGRQSLTVETDGEDGNWFGEIVFPQAQHEDISFKLSRQGKPYDSSPFKLIGDHNGSIVNCWLNLNRPISLIEPFVNYRGAGAISANFRLTARTGGKVGSFLKNARVTGALDEVKALIFSSDTLNALCKF